MDTGSISLVKEKENEEDVDEDDSLSSGLFCGKSGVNQGGDGEANNKEEIQFDDQDELEGAEQWQQEQDNELIVHLTTDNGFTLSSVMYIINCCIQFLPTGFSFEWEKQQSHLNLGLELIY